MTRLPSFQVFAHSAPLVVAIVLAALLVWAAIAALNNMRHPSSRKSASEPSLPGEEARLRKPGRRFTYRPGSSRQGLPAWVLPMRRKRAGERQRRQRRRITAPAPRPVGRLLFLLCGAAVPVGLFLAGFLIEPGSTTPVAMAPRFSVSFTGPGGHGIPKSYVNATVGQRLWIKVRVKSVSGALIEPRIDIQGPGSIAFQGCNLQSQGEERTAYAHGRDAHINPGDLASRVTAKVVCELSVERRIPDQEPIVVAVTDSNRERTETRELFLDPSGGRSGREEAEALVEHELRRSPAEWSAASFVTGDNAMKRIGREWPLLSPRALHGLGPLPGGRRTNLAHLWSDRSQPKGLIQFKAEISGSVISMDTFTVGEDKLLSKRYFFPLGLKVGETMAWCAVTRSTSQPELSEGQSLEVEAAVLGYARSETTGGSAAMLDCPAVRRVRGARSIKEEVVPGGATAAPAGPGG